MPDDKPLTAYKLKQKEEEQKEFPCGIMHVSIEEAMVHAEKNLGFRDAGGQLTAKLEPLLGSMYGDGTVVGWTVGPRKRFRVDFEPNYAVKNAEEAKKKNGVNKGTQGIHVNEEDFTRGAKPKICHPTQSTLLIADLLWRKWTSKYGRRGKVTAEDIEKMNR